MHAFTDKCVHVYQKTAMALYEEILEAKGVESTAKVNIYLNFVRIGLFLKDAELTTKSIDKAEK